MRAGPTKQPILSVPIRLVMLKVLGAAHSPPKSKPVALEVAERDSSKPSASHTPAGNGE